MLENCKTGEERWSGVQALIERWLADRQELVVLYCSVSGVSSLSADCTKSTSKIRQFCQILLDYTSAGHFEVYDQLAKEAEQFKDGSKLLLQKLYPDIQVTTDAILRFNDLFDTDEHCEQAINRLKGELSILGEHLVNRFNLEDQLIQVLHAAHTRRESEKPSV